MSNCDFAGRERARAETDREGGKARTHVFEDMSLGQNVDLIIVCTNEDLISAKRVTVGDGTRHWGGHMSDSTLQQLSQDGATGTAKMQQAEAGQAQGRGGTNFKGMGQRY
jgi:hypothetical protein